MSHGPLVEGMLSWTTRQLQDLLGRSTPRGDCLSTGNLYSLDMYSDINPEASLKFSRAIKVSIKFAMKQDHSLISGISAEGGVNLICFLNIWLNNFEAKLSQKVIFNYFFLVRHLAQECKIVF